MAAEIALREVPLRLTRTAALQAHLWRGISEELDHVRLNGPEPGPERISTNLNVSVEFVEGESLALMLDAHGIAVASGPSCAGKSIRIPPVLTAIGLDHSLALGSIILSLGRDNTEPEMDYAVAKLAQLACKLREMSPTWDEFQRGTIDSITKPRQKAIWSAR
jgi:cysteine desulfurase